MRKTMILATLILGMFLIITRGPTYSGVGSGELNGLQSGALMANSDDIFGAYPNGGLDRVIWQGSGDGPLQNSDLQIVDAKEQSQGDLWVDFAGVGCGDLLDGGFKSIGDPKKVSYGGGNEGTLNKVSFGQVDSPYREPSKIKIVFARSDDIMDPLNAKSYPQGGLIGDENIGV